MAKRVLLGMHDYGVVRSLERLAKTFGYEAHTIFDGRELLDLARQGKYNACLMEANLGNPMTTQVQIAYDAWQIFKPRVESGEARFLAFAGLNETIQAAITLGIPAKYVVNKSQVDLPKFFG